MKRHAFSQSIGVFFLCTVLFGAGMYAFRTDIARFIWTHTMSDAARHFDPKNDKLLFEMGSYFLDARNNAYDIDKAHEYLQTAARLNSDIPYVHHQLARVYFLRGDFNRALAHIMIEIAHGGEKRPKAYYIRALIYGFMEEYEFAAQDYDTYLRLNPTSWAGRNDYAWVLLKANKPAQAEEVVREGLRFHPNNPWLLSIYTVILIELGRSQEAREFGRRSAEVLMTLDESQWLDAYPGNDPRIAHEGILAFQEAVRENFQRVLQATSTPVTP